MNPTTLPIGALKIRDAAKYLGGISEVSVRRLIKRGILQPNRALRHVLIPVSELDRFLTGDSMIDTVNVRDRVEELNKELGEFGYLKPDC